MGYYDQIGAGPLEIRTPGATLAEMQTVDAIVAQLIADMRGTPAPAAVTEAFNRFIAEWSRFYDENKAGFGAWWARGTSSVWNKVAEFRNRAIDWRSTLTKSGVETIGPTVAKTDKASFFGRWGGWLMLGVAGAVFYFMRNRRDG